MVVGAKPGMDRVESVGMMFLYLGFRRNVKCCFVIK